jgi:hypothetical protein
MAQSKAEQADWWSDELAVESHRRSHIRWLAANRCCALEPEIIIEIAI